MAKQLRIAVYHNLHSGGALRALHGMLKGLEGRFQFDLYAPSCSENRFFDLLSLVDTHSIYAFKPLPQLRQPFGRLNYAARYLDLFRIEALQKKIAREIDRKNYDLVFIHHCQFTQAPAILRYLKTPTVYYLNEPLRSAYEPPVFRSYSVKRSYKQALDRLDLLRALYLRRRKKIDQAATRSASLILANSFYTRETAYRVYGKDARVVYPGIDADAFKPVAAAKDGGLLSVGALTPLKGFDFIIRSLALLPPGQRPALTIASNYQELSEKRYLEQMSRDYGVDLRLLSKIGDETLVQLYNRAQATVCASIMEPFGLTPLESMACQTPVIAVAEGGLRETVLPGQTGLSVDRDPSQCVEAIRDLLDHPEAAACMGENGREHVLERWTWEKTLPKLDYYLERAAETGAAG